MVLPLVLLVAPIVSKATDDKNAFVTGGTVTAGNSIYSVYVQDISGGGVGLYTITTGPAHPAGAGLNVLYGNGSPGTTFNTIRSYTSGTDYVQAGGTTSVNNVVLLDSFGTVSLIGSTGVRTTYALPGPPTTADTITITTDVNVHGTTSANSTVEVTTRVANNGAAPVAIGIRYLWDMQIGNDDGPTFQQISPDGAVLVNETEFSAPGFLSYRIEDNDTNPAPPTFLIFGTVTGPSLLVPKPTAPDLLQYACWPSAVVTAFEYSVNPSRDIATTASDCRGFAGGDTTVNYFFGHDQAHAVTVPPGGAFAASASLFLTEPSVRCGDNIVNQPSEQCDGTDAAACPGSCLPDCTCPPLPTAAAPALSPPMTLLLAGLLTLGGWLHLARPRSKR